MQCQCPRVFIAVVFLVVIGILCIAFGVGIIPYIIHQKIIQGLQLRKDSEAVKTWMNPPAAIYIDFYFFNVTNADEVTKKNAQPRVQQMGPYVYREIRNKTDIEFVNDGTALRYREQKWYVFDRNKSCGDETDMFTSVNIPILTLATITRFQSSYILALLKFALFTCQLFERHSVRELLWGYQVHLPSALKPFIGNLTFGIYFGPTGNGTDDGIYEVDAGINDISNIGQINSWQNFAALPYWTDAKCNLINGSDGSFWHPFISKKDRLYVFISDLCRSLYLTHDESPETPNSVNNINTVRFVPPPEVLADPHTNPENFGFCTPDAEHCLLAGALNVSECKNGAPIVMSEPHFTEADHVYQTAVAGIEPDPVYRTYIDIEPTTGVALNLSRKIQINVFLQRLETFSNTYFLNNNTFVFPIFWLNEHAAIDDAESVKLKSEVLSPIHTAQIVCYVLDAVGGLLVLLAVVLTIVRLVSYRCAPRSPTNVQIAPSRQGFTSNVAAASDDDDVHMIDAGTA